MKFLQGWKLIFFGAILQLAIGKFTRRRVPEIIFLDLEKVTWLTWN